VGNNTMVQREQSKLEKAFTPKGSVAKKSPKPKAKTTKEHLQSYADNPGQQIGGKGYLVG
jgi:hypothetical protein